jgi:hypothetical protein
LFFFFFLFSAAYCAHLLLVNEQSAGIIYSRSFISQKAGSLCMYVFFHDDEISKEKRRRR